MVTIHWFLRERPENIDLFTCNRIGNIRSNIQLATELFHVKGKQNPADQGTRWRSMSTDMVMNNTKILECEMASPESEVFCGKEWMTDLEKAKLNVEEQDAYNQAFKQKPGTLAGKEIKLINEGALKTWSNKAK